LSVRRAVIVEFNSQTLWGFVVYAVTEEGHNVVDAISAALLARAKSAAHELRLRYVDKDVRVMEFHSTSVHGSAPMINQWPQVGQLVDLHLNDSERLVSVWHQD